MSRPRPFSMVVALLLLAGSLAAGTGLTLRHGRLSDSAAIVATIRLERRPGRDGGSGGVRPLLATVLGVETTRITSGAWNDADRLLVAGHDPRLWIFAADGSRAALPRGPGRIRAVRRDPAGRGWVVAGRGLELRSPDGERIAAWEGHQAGLFDLAVAPAGDRIAAASWDHTVRTWRGDGTPVAVIGGLGRTTRVALLSGGARVVTAAGGPHARIWTFDGEPVATVDARQGQVRGVVPAPTDDRFVLLDSGPVARLIDPDGAEIADLPGRTAAWSAAWRDDGHLLAVGRADGTVGVHDRDGRLLRELHGHSAAVAAIAFLPDGGLVTGGGDRTLRAWDADGGERAVIEGMPGPGWRTQWVHELHVAPDGRHLLVIFKSEGREPPWVIRMADFLE